MDVNVLPLIINGEEVSSVSTDFIDVVDPSSQQVLCRQVQGVPCSTKEEMELIVHTAVEAQKQWREVPVQQRTRVMIKFQTLLVEHKDRIADIIVKENGKTKVDALGDVTRGIEVVEHSLGMPTLMMGEAVEQISRDMDTSTIRQPLGVVGGIAPFNFPAMIPLWMMPIALGTGNAFILKPSEKVPSASMMIVKLAIEAGFPKGIVSVLHGGKEAADFICSHPAIRAVSFVGSSLVGRAIYDMCTKVMAGRSGKAGKRVQCNLGAKNHAVVMPDANKDQVRLPPFLPCSLPPFLPFSLPSSFHSFLTDAPSPSLQPSGSSMVFFTGDQRHPRRSLWCGRSKVEQLLLGARCVDESMKGSASSFLQEFVDKVQGEGGKAVHPVDIGGRQSSVPEEDRTDRSGFHLLPVRRERLNAGSTGICGRRGDVGARWKRSEGEPGAGGSGAREGLKEDEG
eukprot:759535-Hanusia_phi.AAC.2